VTHVEEHVAQLNSSQVTQQNNHPIATPPRVEIAKIKRDMFECKRELVRSLVAATLPGVNIAEPDVSGTSKYG
jgi:hypothetical protein